MPLRLWAAVLVLHMLTPTSSGQLTGSIEGLRGISGHRSVRLSWKYLGNAEADGVEGFIVQYSEVDSWKPRYHRRLLMLDRSRMTGGNVILPDNHDGYFRAIIYHLRASTEYKVNVMPKFKEVSSSRFDEYRSNQFDAPDIFGPWTLVSTLPFTAKVTHCAKDEAVVRVTTGRHFGGKIGVTNVNKKACEVKGDRKNIGDTVDFVINFERCGAIKNGTSVLSSIVVQENAIVMTGSDRQFIVNCSYAPAFLVVSAAVHMPVGQEDNSLDENSISNVISDEKVFTYDKYKENNMRQSRVLAPDHQASASSNTVPVTNKKSGVQAGQIVVISFFVLASIFGLFGALYWILIQAKRRNPKTTELPDGGNFEKSNGNNIIILDGAAPATAGGVIATSSDVSLVSVKNISDA